MDPETAQKIIDGIYHLEGIGAGILAFMGVHTGFAFARYFFERAMKWI